MAVYANVRPWHGFFAVIDTAGDALGGYSNLNTPWGHFHRVTDTGLLLRHARAPQAVPEAGFDLDVEVLGLYDGEITFGQRIGCVTMVATDGADAYYTETYDDGATYTTPTMLTANAINSRIKGGKDRYLIWLGFRYDSGSSGPGTIVGKYKGPGDAAFSSEFTAKDSLGAAISFSDVKFDFCFAEEGTNRLVLTANKAGDSGPTEFYSSDLGQTWVEI